MSILNKEKILELARLFIEEGKYDKAIKEYEKILIVDPSDMRVKLRVAELHVKRKQISDAIRVYREVAEAYTQEGFYLKAVTVYKNVLRINPSIIEVNDKLAELYEKMGLVGDAVRQYGIYAAALEHKGEMRKVMEIRRRIVELAPDDGGARIRLAELYQREGMSEESIDQYEEYARRLEGQGGNKARLVEMYEKILSYRTDREDMLRALVRIYYEGGEKKKALKWLEFAKALTAVDTELLGMQAEIYASLNQAETARSKYLTLSDLFREQGDDEGALEALAKIVVMIPSEQERVEKRASEMGGDARDRFRSIVERLQQEETDRIRKEEEELSAKEELSEKKRIEEEKVEEEKPQEEKPVRRKLTEKEWEEITSKSKIPVDMDRTVIIPVAQKPKPKERPKEKLKVETKPPVTPQEKIKRAKAAYDLGLFYKKIGLEGDAKQELSRAYELYKELEKTSAEAAVRLSEIRLMIGERKKAKPKAVSKTKSKKQK